MYKLKRVIVWMRRMHHSRGFGVQSPYDYRFVRYVVNEHWPYYAYDELAQSVQGIDRKSRKLCRLYFRIANWRQPERVVDYCPQTDAYIRYMQAGCQKVTPLRICLGDGSAVPSLREDMGPIELLRMSLYGNYEAFWQQVIRHVNARSVIIIERIKRDKETKAFWERVKADERTGVTFDLYYCGIVFYNTKRYKQHYIVNF